MARWRVDIIRQRAEHLGTIEAANEKEAIEKAAKSLTFHLNDGTELCRTEDRGEGLASRRSLWQYPYGGGLRHGRLR